MEQDGDEEESEEQEQPMGNEVTIHFILSQIQLINKCHPFQNNPHWDRTTGYFKVIRPITPEKLRLANALVGKMKISVTKAAKLLDVSRTSLQTKLSASSSFSAGGGRSRAGVDIEQLKTTLRSLQISKELSVQVLANAEKLNSP